MTPNWYAGKTEHGRVVPTWNYETVHVYGRLHWREDAAWLLANVTALTARFEADQPTPWAVKDAPEDFINRQIGGIIGVELRIDRIEAKRKLSQNRSEADRLGVISGLVDRDRGQDKALAAIMTPPKS